MEYANEQLLVRDLIEDREFLNHASLSGPFVRGKDIDGDEKKYLLVGSYTWPVYEGHEWEKDEVIEGKPEWPVLEEEEAEGIPPLEPVREPWQDEYPDMEDYYPQSEAEGPGVHEDEERMEVHPGGELEPGQKEEQAQGSPEEDKKPEEVEQGELTEEELKAKNKPTKVVTMMLCVPLGSRGIGRDSGTLHPTSTAWTSSWTGSH